MGNKDILEIPLIFSEGLKDTRAIRGQSSSGNANLFETMLKPNYLTVLALCPQPLFMRLRICRKGEELLIFWFYYFS